MLERHAGRAVAKSYRFNTSTSFVTCTPSSSILPKLVLDIANFGVQPGSRILEHSVLAKKLPPLVLPSPPHGIEMRIYLLELGTQCLAGPSACVCGGAGVAELSPGVLVEERRERDVGCGRVVQG